MLQFVGGGGGGGGVTYSRIFVIFIARKSLIPSKAEFNSLHFATQCTIVNNQIDEGK